MTWAAEEFLLGFARALRAAGVSITMDREITFVRSAGLVGLAHRNPLYWAGRATLTSSPADLEPYDQVFDQWFSGTQMTGLTYREPPSHRVVQAGVDDALADGDSGAGPDQPIPALASAREVLRRRDIAELAVSERAALNALFATLKPQPPMRRARRHTRSHRGRIDGRATLRAALRRWGEPAQVVHRQPARRARSVVLLIDVSGSMSAYADALLRLAHTVVRSAPRSTEVFTVGTRLTHVTSALTRRDADHALLAAGEAVADWSGGTRLGDVLGAFVDRWGRRGMARGSVVVIFSDGWERGDAAVLSEQMRRLAGLAHRVVWVNPHRGRVAYRPVQSGIVAALPYVDDFVAGHSLAAFGDVVEVMGRA